MLTEPIRVLSEDAMEQIHQAALVILERVGMKMESEKALGYLKKIGCEVEESKFLVKFPRKVVQGYVEKMKADYGQARGAPEGMSVRYSHIRFRKERHRIHRDFTVNAGGFCCFIYDLEGRRRYASMDDVHRAIHLVNQMDAIDYTGLPVADQETPVGIRPVKMAAELAKYTTKFGGVETFKKDDIPYMIEMGTIIKGSKEQLQAEPILIGYAEARSPLCLDRNMAEIFMEYIERGFPQTVDTMPNGGATAPVTAAGLLALGLAETLGPMVLAYAIDEKAVVGVDIIPSYCDMQSGLFRYASADRMSLLAARVQMISEYYGCPSGVHGGKTDSCFVNVQAGIEKAMSMVFPVLAGAVGVGTVGHLENAVTFSPQQLVIDNEISRAVHRALQPMDVNDETLALEVIAQVGINGNYLENRHTVEHFREELFLSQLFETSPWSSVQAQPTKGMENKAWQEASAIWQEKPEPILDTQDIKALDEIVAHAAKTFSAI